MSTEELRDLVRATSGEIYSRETVRRDILALTEAYADKGYAFADIVPTVSLDQQTRLVNLSFTTRPGPKVYIGRIDIIGNERTQDRVIRREMRLDEGELTAAASCAGRASGSTICSISKRSISTPEPVPRTTCSTSKYSCGSAPPDNSAPVSASVRLKTSSSRFPWCRTISSAAASR